MTHPSPSESDADASCARYDRDGFVVLEGFVDAQTRGSLLARVAELARTLPARPLVGEWFLGSADQVRAFSTDGVTDKIGHALHRLDPVFAPFSTDPRIAGVAAELGLDPSVAIQSMVLLKPPGTAAEVAMHQDHTFLWTDPPSAVGLWIALEDATVDNGCLWAWSGGHRHPPRHRFRRVGDGTALEVLDPTPWPEDHLVPLEVAAGTCVVLHGLLPHRSGPNRSTRGRTAYSLHLVDPRATYAPDNWLRR